MCNIETRPAQCPVARREIRNVSGNIIRVSSEHRLSMDEIHHAIELAESIFSMQDPKQIYFAFMDHKANGIGSLEALTRTVSSRVARDIQNHTGHYSPNDRVHKLISDAGASCASVTALNCGIYDYIEGEEDSLNDFFTNDITHEASADAAKGKTILSTCIAPQLGRAWIKAATEALQIYDPTITPKFTAPQKQG